MYFPVLGWLVLGCSLLPLGREQFQHHLGNQRNGTQADDGVKKIDQNERSRGNGTDPRGTGRPSQTNEQYIIDHRHLYGNNKHGQSKEDVEGRSSGRTDAPSGSHETNTYGYSGEEYKQGRGGYRYGHNDHRYGRYGYNNGNGYGHNDNYGHRGENGYGYGRGGHGSHRGSHGRSGDRNSRQRYHKNQYRPVYTQNNYLLFNKDFQVFSITTPASVVAAQAVTTASDPITFVSPVVAA